MGTRGSPLANGTDFGLTPLLCVIGLGLYSLHDDRALWHSLHGRLVPAILLAVPVMMLTALMAAGLRGWVRVLVSAVLSAVAVGCLYYVLAGHYYDLFQPGPATNAEGRGNIVTIWQGEAQVSGVIAGLAVVASSLMRGVLSRLPRRG